MTKTPKGFHTCQRCKQVKPNSEFRSYKNGLYYHYWCNQCIAESKLETQKNARISSKQLAHQENEQALQQLICRGFR